MQLKSVKLKLFFTQSFILILFFASFLFIGNETDYWILFLKNLLIVQFLLSYIGNYLLNKWWYNAYGIFLTLVFVFLLSRVFLDVVGVADLAQTSFFSSYSFSASVVEEILVILFISLVSLNVGFLLNGKASYIYIKRDSCFSFEQPLVQLGRLFFYFGLLPTIYKVLLVFFNVLKHGYLSLFLSPELYDVPLIVSFLSMLFPIGFFFCHIGKMTSSKELKIMTVIFVISILLEILIGKRGTVLTQLIVLIWFYAYFYGQILKLKQLVFFSFLLVLSAQATLFLRMNNISDLLSLNTFLFQQGVSIQVLGYAIQEGVQQKYSFSFLDFFRPIIQSTDVFFHKITGATYNLSPEQRMERYNNYSMVIANEVDSMKFSSGFGIGGSYIAELYIITGYYGVILFNLFFGFFLSRIEYLARFGRGLLVLFLLVLPDLVYLPRGYIFEALNTQSRTIILLGIVFLFIKFFRKKVA